MQSNFKRLDLLILLFALTSALLYSCLLPLWEGFDEPFHYGYVQSLSVDHRVPVLNQTTISSEIRTSLTLAPVSGILHRSLPRSISFDDWFTLTRDEKLERENVLAELPPALKKKPSEILNYEAQQAPLAYLVLAPIDAILSGVPLRRRVFLLRLIVATASTIFLFGGATLLLNGLALEQPFRLAALACIFESQMLWASVAHVGNDWLAIPLAVTFFGFLVLLVRDTRPGYAVGVAFLLAAGLLTKAYFLAFVPVFAAILIRCRQRSAISWRTATGAIAIVLISLSWYVRNLILYGSLSGTQEAVAGIGLKRALPAFFQIDWFYAAMSLPKWALWTGNWSFLSFSKITLDVELVLLAGALILFLTAFRRISSPEWWVIFGCGMFVLGFIYQICVTWVHTSGKQYAEPWYEQCIVPCVWAIAFLGLQRSPRAGRFAAIMILFTTGWIAMATYVAKLFPFYGGYRGRATLPAIFHWWTSDPASALSGLVLGPVPLVFCLLAAFIVLLIVVTVTIMRGLAGWRGGYSQ